MATTSVRGAYREPDSSCASPTTAAKSSRLRTREHTTECRLPCIEQYTLHRLALRLVGADRIRVLERDLLAYDDDRAARLDRHLEVRTADCVQRLNAAHTSARPPHRPARPCRRWQQRLVQLQHPARGVRCYLLELRLLALRCLLTRGINEILRATGREPRIVERRENATRAARDEKVESDVVLEALSFARRHGSNAPRAMDRFAYSD